MARFTTRVQLNGAPSRRDYEALHAAMKKNGFLQTITGANGITYQLPHAEYNCESDLPIQQIRDAARAAAETVWSDVNILVTQSAARSWYLNQVN